MDINAQVIALSRQSPAGFSVEGPYGVVTAWPESAGQAIDCQPRYWVDIIFLPTGQPEQHQCRRGFKLSTVWCLCAGVCWGEEGLNATMIDEINALCGENDKAC
jgi:hypothetical protein